MQGGGGGGGGGSSFLPSSFEGYSKPTTGALGERVNAMRQAFQVDVSLFSVTFQMLLQ